MKIETKFDFGEKVRHSIHETSPVYFVDGFQISPCGCIEVKCCTFSADELKISFFREDELEKAKKDAVIGFFSRKDEK